MDGREEEEDSDYDDEVDDQKRHWDTFEVTFAVNMSPVNLNLKYFISGF